MPATKAVRHGRITLEVPKGWADESTISYGAPIEEGLAAPLSGKRAPAYRSNLTVSVELKPDGIADEAEFHREVAAALRDNGVEIAEVRTAPITIAGRTGALSVRKVNLAGQLVRQYTAAVFIGPNVLIATASTAESEALRQEKLLIGLLEQIKLD